MRDFKLELQFNRKTTANAMMQKIWFETTESEYSLWHPDGQGCGGCSPVRSGGLVEVQVLLLMSSGGGVPRPQSS